MKKLFIFVFLLGIFTTFVYHRYYKTGEINSFLEQYPYSEYAQSLEYYLGILCSMLSKSDSAIFRFKRVIEIYELNKLKPAAYYHIAQIYEEKKEKKLALRYYRLTFEKFPKSHYGDLAKNRYDYLLLLGYKE